MPWIWLRIATDAPPVLIPLPKFCRHLIVFLPSCQLLWLIVFGAHCPETIRATKGGDATLSTDASTCQDNQLLRSVEHLRHASFRNALRWTRSSRHASSKGCFQTLNGHAIHGVKSGLKLLPLLLQAVGEGFLRRFSQLHGVIEACCGFLALLHSFFCLRLCFSGSCSALRCLPQDLLGVVNTNGRACRTKCGAWPAGTAARHRSRALKPAGGRPLVI
mmetsp:Transcript_12149/g.22335  ORF Transcript_12149/g.22335 Transcript_12149/m.22335 type:complete len:218 (-) Transcript_12149:20-673(-)